MDRNKIKDATRLDADLEYLELQIKRCQENGDILYYWDLLRYLSPVGKATVQSAIQCAAETERVEFERKIAEL